MNSRSARPIILGLNAYHADAAAALMVGDELHAAAEEERFTRQKHQTGVPLNAARYCLGEVGLTLSEIDFVAINMAPSANRWRKLAFGLMRRPDLKLVLARLRTRKQRGNILQFLSQLLDDQVSGRRPPTLRYVEHHQAHLASAYLCSPFDEAAVVSVDGFGDFSSAAWGVGRGGRIYCQGRVYFPHSMGIFYEALTQYLGFPNYGDEYKVMGMAAWGQPTYLSALRQLVSFDDGKFQLNQEYFRHARENVEYSFDSGAPVIGQLFSTKLENLLGPARQPGGPVGQREYDLAASIQALYEEMLLGFLKRVQARTGLSRLCLAGGCAMNSLANGRIPYQAGFKDVYIPLAPGDAGGAAGAAMYLSALSGAGRCRTVDSAALGPKFERAQIEQAVAQKQAELEKAGVHVQALADNELFLRVAQSLANGDVVGWFRGRMEFGSRALGNRSILVDPRRSDMQAYLNGKIKLRESFRPFAPSVLEDFVSDWFDCESAVPFMSQVFPVLPDKRAIVPAITHQDGTGRLQTVSRTANPAYYSLISAFNQLTGVPLLLNTSFNENEPIVCTPQEALDCFLRTRMDTLVLESFVLTRKP